MTEDDTIKYHETRSSFTGKTLTHSQFDETWAITYIMKRNIEKTGSFVEPLKDYSHAFSRTEKFDQLRGETIIRDVFKDRYGMSMNQMRERLIENEKNLPENARSEALKQANRIVPLIQEGETQPFYRAYDSAGVALAGHLGITETKAKELMKDVYQENYGRDLYEVGKDAEKEYHQPAREAAREKAKTQTASRTKSRARA